MGQGWLDPAAAVGTVRSNSVGAEALGLPEVVYQRDGVLGKGAEEEVCAYHALTMMRGVHHRS